MPVFAPNDTTFHSKDNEVNLLQSFGDHIHDVLVLLAPEGCGIPPSFRRCSIDRNRHGRLLRPAQRVRGAIYLADGALQASQLTSDGRHVQYYDYDSWHLLAVDGNGEVHGCARYRHLTGNVGFDDLSVRDSWLARSDRWGLRLRAAVESELVCAGQRGTAFAEAGGWAIVPEKRCKVEALQLAMATYSLARILGGCVGISTATERHRSASILRRIGGRSLEHAGTELPSYYDPQYRCQMEVLRFDSGVPDESCRKWVEQMSMGLAEVQIVAALEPAVGHLMQPALPMPWPSLPQLGWVA